MPPKRKRNKVILHRFGKAERICDQILISKIFSRGDLIKSHPVYAHYLCIDSKSITPIQVLFSVPKRKISLAVKRNQIKRRMREAYRKNKSDIISQYENANSAIRIVFVYGHKDVLPYKILEKKIILVLERLSEMHEKDIC